MIDLISASNIIALLALGTSVVTWRKSRAIEERIRADSDERSKFDFIFANPLAARLESLENVISEFERCARQDKSVPEIQDAVNRLQKNEHTDWFIGVDSILESHQAHLSEILFGRLNSYWDKASDEINQIGKATSCDQAKEVLRQLRSLSDKFLSEARTVLFEHRAGITGSSDPIFVNLFRKKSF